LNGFKPRGTVAPTASAGPVSCRPPAPPSILGPSHGIKSVGHRRPWVSPPRPVPPPTAPGNAPPTPPAPLPPVHRRPPKGPHRANIMRERCRRLQLLGECSPPATAPRFHRFSDPTSPHCGAGPPGVQHRSPELPRHLEPSSSSHPSTPHVDRPPRCVSALQTLTGTPSIILLSHSRRCLHTSSRRSSLVAAQCVGAACSDHVRVRSTTSSVGPAGPIWPLGHPSQPRPWAKSGPLLCTVFFDFF
jgi:hypothetical protein